jgi:protein disulfide-isomerase A6
MVKELPQNTKVVGILTLWRNCALHDSRPPEWISHTRWNNAFASITKKSGVKSNIKPPPPPVTAILDIHTFDDVVLVSSPVLFHVSRSRLGFLIEQRS